MTKESIDYWFSHVTGSKDFSIKIFESLQKEIPLFISWIGERACNLQCSHCIFQEERSFGENKDIGPILANLVSQVSRHRQPIVIHEGRVLRKWHLPIMAKLQALGARVGLIDNGTYLRHADSFEQKIDWIDISIDGTKDVHNAQREDPNAYQTAMQGIRNARMVSHKVTSLFTLTSRNYHNVYRAANDAIEFVDELHVTPVSPVRAEIAWTEATADQFATAWTQLQRLAKEYPNKFFVRMYRHEDLVKLISIDPDAFRNSIRNPVGVSQGRIMFTMHGVPVSYLPKSLSVNETIVVDVDGWYRLPYSIALTISELTTGMDRFGNDIRNYSLRKLTADTNLAELYPLAVSTWRKHVAEKSLAEERNALHCSLNQSV